MKQSTLRLAAMLFGSFAIPVGAQVTFSHAGKTNPVTEGWSTADIPGPGTSAGPITDDLGLGIDAWSVVDNSNAESSSLAYQQLLSGDQITQAATKGWRLSVFLRVAEPALTPDYSVWVGYADGATSYEMTFGSEANGDPSIVLGTGWDEARVVVLGPSSTLVGGANAYHRFDLVYDPSTLAARLFVDGVSKMSGYQGWSGTLAAGYRRVVWGSSSSPGQGSGNYSLVEWEIGPLAPALDIRVSQVELCWNTLASTDVWYQLQYRTALQPEQWRPLNPSWLQGSGSRYCTNDTILVGQPQRFYRVVTTNSVQQP